MKHIMILFILMMPQWNLLFGADNVQGPYLPHNAYRTYKETVLTTETLRELAQSDAFTIKDTKLIRWLNDHKKLITTLAASLVYSHANNFKRGVKAGNRLLRRYKLKNKAMHNFIFRVQVESKKYWIKIAGPHRIKQLYPKLIALDTKTVSKRARHNVIRTTPTYQNAGRFARYLLYKKWTDDQIILPFKVPTTYLFTFWPSAPLDDEHCIIIEEDVPHIENKHILMKKLLDMDSAIKDFIKHLGLWDLHFDQFVMTAEGELFYIDLEDRDTDNPEMFFNKDYFNIKENIDHGLRGLSIMFTLFKKLLKKS